MDKQCPHYQTILIKREGTWEPECALTGDYPDCEGCLHSSEVVGASALSAGECTPEGELK